MKHVLFFLAVLTASPLCGQNIVLKNRTVDDRGGAGIAYVNIGLNGKNVGTVSDERGFFKLELPANAADDTLLFSCIGYETLKVPVEVLKELGMPVVMSRKAAYLPEVQVTSGRTKEQFFGYFTESPVLQAGFNQNILGKECGVLMRSKRRAVLDQVQINFGKCTYDSVNFRLNVYHKKADGSFENILKQPIVLSFSKIELKETLAIDVKPYNIEVLGEFMVSVEYVQDLGPGTLYFKSKMNKTSYIRSTSQANWVEIPLGLSIGVFAQVER
ncbi:MAG: hypothetical protein C0424_05430 [Sphingobacteriaceae bacterium]|nr:hypothetical protein [Sphingobacteriaceae bacterium]